MLTANLGETAMYMGDYVTACSYLAESVQIALDIDRKSSIINVLEQFAQLSIYLEEVRKATQLLGFASSLRAELNMPVSPPNRERFRQRETMLQEQLQDEFDTHWQLGSSMGLTAIAQVALSIENHLTQA